ncbi:MAG: acyl-CoA synthetase [Proteobacteria bacterium]|nr:acyl-CoA synthetase [Pseudomonadota bacterium]
MSEKPYKNIYLQGLEKNGANYVPLTPVTFLERAAATFPQKAATIHGDRRINWRDTYRRCRQLASALKRRGVRVGDTVSIVCPNTPAMFESHFGVPMIGAVLNTINIRLDAGTISFILEHAASKVVFVDREFGPVLNKALEDLKTKPLVISIDDSQVVGGELIGSVEYEAFLKEGDPEFMWSNPDDEWDAISLNYTSGTTGDPKGVVYHHRGAYLNALGNQIVWGMKKNPVYLWTLPMFHCNGWCFPWTITAMAGTNVCLRQVNAQSIIQSIRDHKVGYFCGAPIVLGMLINEFDEETSGFDHSVEIMTAAAAPPAAIIESMEKMGFQIHHAYGLTETYGPAVICEWHEEWDKENISERTRLKARQGVRYHVLDGLAVKDPDNMKDVPADGETIGEIMMKGNNVMKGYLKNSKTTEESFTGGWFHSGDLAVMHADGYIEIKDRSKDIIISGGENISSIEVEGVLFRHPAVVEAAVVARPDEKWGETPCAFVRVKKQYEDITEQELIDFCRKHLAHFKVPRTIVFKELPRTSTGKIQKFLLRKEMEKLS